MGPIGRVVAVVAAFGFAAAPCADAQVIARQGSASADDVVQFRSPMILELPISNLVTLSKAEPIAGARKYRCDGVYFSTLQIEKRRTSRDNAHNITFAVSGTIFVPESNDRFANVTVRLKKGDTSLAAGGRFNIDAEEVKVTPFVVLFDVPKADLADSYATQPAPVLEVTLAVRENS